MYYNFNGEVFTKGLKPKILGVTVVYKTANFNQSLSQFDPGFGMGRKTLTLNICIYCKFIQPYCEMSVNSKKQVLFSSV